MTEPGPRTVAGEPTTDRLWARTAVRLVVALLFVGIPLFLGAGTLAWVRGWLFLVLLGFTFLINLTVMIVKNPILLRERWKRRSDTKYCHQTRYRLIPGVW